MSRMDGNGLKRQESRDGSGGGAAQAVPLGGHCAGGTAGTAPLTGVYPLRGKAVGARQRPV